jgi:hypothetical protein
MRTSYTERMRRLLRASVLALTLLFGIPAAALLLAHLGLIALPKDAYLSSVTEISRPKSDDHQAHVIERLDTLGAPRAAVARAAIIAAAAHFPGHQEGVDRDWEFYRVSRAGFPSDWTTDAQANGRARCDGCSGAREAVVMVSARVVSLRADRAEVAVDWKLASNRHRSFARSGTEQAVANHDHGSLRITLELVADQWHALQIEPRQ